MSSDRLARALVRLYPRAWRIRYGDEFLAFVAESGLSWRAVADVVVAAAVERVCAVATAGEPIDPTAALLAGTPRRFRDGLAEFAAFMGLMSLTVLALVGTGVPAPSWSWWYQIPLMWSWRHYAATATWTERAVASFCSLCSAMVAAGLAYRIALGLGRLEVAATTDRMFEVILGIYLACSGGRLLYCAVRTVSFGSTWQGLNEHEWTAWRAATLLIVVLLCLNDPDGRVFWPSASLLWMVRRPPFAFTRAGAAQRRAQYEAVFGAGSGPARQ